MQENNFTEKDLFTEDSDYNRDLGLKEAISIVLGRIIGSGIFSTPGRIMVLVVSTSLFGFAWVVGGIVTIFGAVCYAELVAMMPKSGGPYIYLRAAYHPVWAFLRGWAMFFVSETGAIAAVSLVFAEALSALCEIVYGFKIPHVYEVTISIFTIWLLTSINLFGVSLSGIVQNIFSSMKVISIGVIVGISFTSSTGDLTNFITPLWPDKFTGETIFQFAAAIRLVFFAFSGWEGATYIAEEVKNPRKNLPLSLFLGIGGVTLLYIGANCAYFYQLTFPAIEAAPRLIAVSAMKLAIGSAGGIFISAAIMMSVFGNASTQILCKSRSWQAMARDGLFFKKLSAIHPKYRTPNNSLIAQGLWASVLLIFAGFAKDSYSALIDYFFATGTIFNIMTFASVFILRKKYPDIIRPYRAWLYPVSLILIIIIYITFLILTLIDEPLPSFLGIALTSTGLIYYYRTRIAALLKSIFTK